MSAIGGTSSALYSFVNGLTAGNSSQPASAAGGAEQTLSQAIAGAGQHRRHKGGGKGEQADLFQQIQQSVTTALQAAQGSSASAADPNKVIEQALAKIFQQNASTSAGGTDADGDGDNSAAASTTDATSASSKTAQQTFAQTLQANGVDAQQFRSDLLAALKQAQGGQSNPSTAFAGFPQGLLIDTTA